MAPQGSSPRMLVIGLDAADPFLIEKWSDEGILPALNFLRKEGTWIRLQHAGEMPSASVWPSIYTGTHPGKHGIYHSLQVEPGKGKLKLIKPNTFGQPPFWWALDRSGKRSIIMDVPFSYPLRDFGGIQIFEWGTYERHYGSHSLPREVLTEVSRRFGTYPFGEEMNRDAPSSIRHFWRARAQLLAGAALKGGVIKRLMSNEAWDCFIVVFGETHPAGHYFWSFQSNNHRNSLSSAPPEFATTIRDIYKAVDQEIMKIIEGLDKRTAILVLSGQGMGPNCAKWHLIPEILSRLGLLVTRSKNDRRSVMQTNWLGEVRDSIPLNWRRSISRHLPGSLRDYLRIYWATSRIDWSQTRAFYLPTDLLGYIRINLKGRDPNGIVEPGSEYDDLCQQISGVLNELVDPRTGRRVVGEVFNTDEVFPGPERYRLPDLIVTWRDEMESNGCYSKEIGTINGDLPDPRTGNHRPQGFAVLCGPGIGCGQASEGHILDIAPTVLRYFGLESPSYIDGRPWTNIFS